MNTDGSLDNLFSSDLPQKIDNVLALPNQKTIVSGLIPRERNELARLKNTGETDLTFSLDFDHAFVNEIVTDLNQRILIGKRTGLQRLLSSGQNDNSFLPPIFSAVNSIIVTPNDEMLVGGTFQTNRFENQTSLVRVISVPSDEDGDGVLDSEDNYISVFNTNQDNFDGDALGDACDLDDDNDSVNDQNDAFPFDLSESIDTDNDGTGDNTDVDDDNIICRNSDLI